MKTLVRYLASTAGAMALLACSCRERGAAAPKASPAKAPVPFAAEETAALLLIDTSGACKVVCMPSGRERRGAMPGSGLLAILDVASHGGKALAAGLTTAARKAPSALGEELVLLTQGESPRTVADNASFAQFSPDGSLLLFESKQRLHVGGGVMGGVSHSHVFALATGKLSPLGEHADPRWEADGQHVRATRLKASLRDRKTHVAGQWSMERIRWNRATGTITSLGPGGGQLPAPRGAATAWSGEALRSPLLGRCTLFFGDGHRHPLAGSLCQGTADDRGVRWSPDGRWLAFTSYASTTADPTGADRPALLDVVSSSGERHPAIASLGRGSAGRKSNVTYPWVDWAPDGHRLVVQDSQARLWLYALDPPARTALGEGQRPMWSPRGGYLLVSNLAAARSDPPRMQAFLLRAGDLTARRALGEVRDARWIAPSGCSEEGGR